MQYNLFDEHFNSYENMEKWVNGWKTSKETSYLKDGKRL